ncbi:MAG: transporter substrate-binding domain-containing protein [Halopseudomonas sp.]
MRRINQIVIYCLFFCVLALSASLAGAEPVVHLTTTVREPYHGPDLPGQGYVTEITSAALQSVGYRLKVTYMPWTRAIRTAALGGSDGVMGALYNEARTLYLSYTEPLVPVEMTLLKRKGEPFVFASSSDLTPYRIAFVRGGAMNRDFDPEIRFEDSANHEQALQQLVAGRVDLMLDSHAVIIHLLQTRYPEYRDRVEFVRPPLLVHPLFNGFSKSVEGYERRLRDFNRGLELIKADGTYQRILKRHGLETHASASAGAP